MKRVAGLAGFTVIIVSLIMAVSALDTLAKQPSEQKIENLYFNRIAVAPFLVGHRQPRMDTSMDDTLSCPLNQICLDDPTIAPEAGATLTRLVLNEIQKRFDKHVIQTGAVDAGYTSIRIDGARDTPRTLARQLGKAITADLMINASNHSQIARNSREAEFRTYLFDRLNRFICSLTLKSVVKNTLRPR